MSERNNSDHPTGIDDDLDLLFAEVRALRDLAADSDQTRGDSRVYDFSIRWGVSMSGRLHRLAHYDDEGRLSSDEQHRYDALRAALREAEPLMDQLGLPHPTTPRTGTNQ